MSSFVADVKHCRVLVSPIGNLIGELSTLLTALSIPTRVPQIEVAVGDNTTVLVMRTLSPLSAADRQLMLEFAHRHGVHWLLQAGRPDQLEPLEQGHRAGGTSCRSMACGWPSNPRISSR